MKIFSNKKIEENYFFSSIFSVSSFLKLSKISFAKSFPQSQKANHQPKASIATNQIKIIFVTSVAIQTLDKTTIKVKNITIIFHQIAIISAFF
jgi:hypothetical protein